MGLLWREFGNVLGFVEIWRLELETGDGNWTFGLSALETKEVV